jgi:hypothetical protein
LNEIVQELNLKDNLIIEEAT